MNELTALLRKNPNPTTVSLEYLNLVDVASLLPRLSRLPGLNTLFLHGNKLKSLPDMSILTGVHTLDLSDNSFRSVRDILASLQSMPSLKVLNYSIAPGREEDEELLVVSLPNLTSLNGTSLVDEAAAKETRPFVSEPQAKFAKKVAAVTEIAKATLPVADSPVQQPQPKNRSGVSFLLQQNEKEKGISAKPTIMMPSLSRLTMNNAMATESKSEAPEETIKRLRSAHVPTSPSLFSPILTTLINSQATVAPTLTPDDVKSVSGLFNAIKDVKSSGNNEEEKRLSTAFDHHLRNVSNRLRERMSELQHDKSAQETEIIMAKHGLYDICFQEIIGLTDSINRDVGQLLRKLRSSHTTLFHAFPHLLSSSGAQSSLLLVMRNDLIRAESEVQQLFDVVNLLDEESERNHAEILKLRSQLSEMQKRNEDMANTLAKSASEGGAAGRLVSMQTSGASSVRVGKEKVLSMSGSFSTSTANNELSSTFSPVEAYATDAKAASSQGSCRSLLLTQVKDFISQIYTAKERSDKRNDENSLPRETMYQHFFSFLHQRYGLKPIIVENAASILMGIDGYSDEDNDIAVFGKILRNEIDEDFCHVQAQLKSTVVDLLRVHLKGRYPMKADSVVLGHLKQRMEGDVCEEEWSDIVKYMYNTEDAGALTMMLKEVIRQRLEPQVTANIAQKSTRSKMNSESQKVENALRQGRILFTDFQKILLDFQLHGHDRFLSRFREIFSAIDDNGDGIVDEEQFREIVSQVNPSKAAEEVQALLDKIDPENHQSINFSQSVNCLSDDIVSMMLQFAAGESDMLETEELDQVPQRGEVVASGPSTPASLKEDVAESKSSGLKRADSNSSRGSANVRGK